MENRQPPPLKFTNQILCACGNARRLSIQFTEFLKTNVVGQIGQAVKAAHYCTVCRIQNRPDGTTVNPEDPDFLPIEELETLFPGAKGWHRAE